MNTTLFLTTKQQYGITVYKDDNEYGLVLDDGTIEYAPKQYLRLLRNDPGSSVREALWRVAWMQYADVDQAAKHYRQTLRFWLKKVADAGKTCSECHTFKHFSQFVKNMDSNDGFRKDCKACYAKKNAERYKARNTQD